MAKSKKLGRCEFEHNGYKIMPIYDGSKPTGKYGVVAGKNLVSEPMSLKNAIETLKNENFIPKKKIKR